MVIEFNDPEVRSYFPTMTPFPRWCVLLVVVGALVAEEPGLSRWVDPLIGLAHRHGSCMPGPSLPHASVYPSPDTVVATPSGFRLGKDVVGFSQLHTQGTGGKPSYGNFLLSPRIGPGWTASDNASPMTMVAAACHSLRARLNRWPVECTVIPAHHSAFYRFSFPVTDDARLVLDVGRKIGEQRREGTKGGAMRVGSVTIDPATGEITGGGTFGDNWNPAPYEVFFCLKVDAIPTGHGTWIGEQASDGVATAAIKEGESVGAWLRFDARTQRTVQVKIGVSFVSVAQARAWLTKEIPAWDGEALQAEATRQWDRALDVVRIPGASDAVKRRIYTALFHAQIQPRNRTGDQAGWPADAPLWDDHYTLWDSWQTLFPFLALVQPDLVADNLRSFVERQRRNGKVSAAFIQGREYQVGQGGDEVDNIIADAYARKVPGVDWKAAYEVLKANAERRTPHYLTHGWVATGERGIYCNRIRSGSATLAFAYNDWCAAQVAAGLGYLEDAKRYGERSRSWRHVWDKDLEDAGFSGFVRNRDAKGKFSQTPAHQGYNTDFYEGTCWIYSYVVPHDVPGLIELMGGQTRFIDRLQYAFSNQRIDFTNEPSFMTPWLFARAQRPYLTSHWADAMFRAFPDDGYLGDEDNGAMSSLNLWLYAGIFPIAGQDIFVLHGPRVPRWEFHLPNGAVCTIIGQNTGPDKPYIQAVTMDGKPLNHPVIHHADLVRGATLVVTMGDRPSAWGCGDGFDAVQAAQQVTAK